MRLPKQTGAHPAKRKTSDYHKTIHGTYVKEEKSEAEVNQLLIPDSGKDYVVDNTHGSGD